MGGCCIDVRPDGTAGCGACPPGLIDYLLPVFFYTSILAILFGIIVFFVYKEGKKHVWGKRMMVWGIFVLLLVLAFSVFLTLVGQVL